MSRQFILALSLSLLACVAAGLIAQSSGPDDPRGDDPMFGQPKHRPLMLTDAQEKELLDALKERMPSRYERLARLKESNPLMYRQVAREAWRWYLRWKDAPKEVQEAYVAEQLAGIRIGQLVGRHAAAASDAERQPIRAELEQAATEQFDANQIILKYRLSVLEEQIDRLQKDLAGRQQQREKLIAESVERWLKGPATKPASRPAKGARTQGSAEPPANDDPNT